MTLGRRCALFFLAWFAILCAPIVANAFDDDDAFYGTLAFLNDALRFPNALRQADDDRDLLDDSLDDSLDLYSFDPDSFDLGAFDRSFDDDPATLDLVPFAPFDASDSDWRASYYPAYPAVYRAQAPIIPPAESPSNVTIGESLASSSGAAFILPPAVGSDRPFEPIPAQTNENSTTLQKLFKYRQSVSGAYTFIPKAKKRGLGIHELEARLLFAFPCKLLEKSPNVNNGYFLLTPSFVYDHVAYSKDNNARAHMESNLFDAGLTTAFVGLFQDLEAKVEVSVGVASSFKKIHGKAVYVRGRAEVSLPIDNEKQIKALGGVAYLNRIKYKLVPIFGFTWDPNPQNQFRIVFPNPRWSHYLSKVNETDWWLQISGDIGGGRWYISDVNAPINGKTSYNVDYDDYRFGAGLAFDCPSRLKGAFEVGGAFKREIRSKAGKDYAPKNSVYLKFGLFY